jgi:esterase/lipase superfamily enzyme
LGDRVTCLREGITPTRRDHRSPGASRPPASCSGILDDLFGGYYGDDIYFHTPTHFLPGLGCSWRLETLRQIDIVLAVGKAAPFLDNNRHLSRLRAHHGGAWPEMAAQQQHM